MKPLSLLLLALLPVPTLVVACGARTGLGERGPVDASAQHDATAQQDTSVEEDAPPLVQDVLVETSLPDVDQPEVVVHDAGAPVPLIASGETRSCVVRPNGGVRCWGLGFIGDGTAAAATTAIDVIKLAGPVVQISIGASSTCVRLQSEDVQCWGNNSPPIVPGGGSLFPVTVPGLVGALDVSVGTTHACVVVSGGGVKCWGANSAGQLGNGSLASSGVPVDVMGLTESAIAVTAKAVFSCALLSSGRVQCWGQGDFGQLGDGTEVSKTSAAAVVPGIVGATAIANGTDFACVLTSTGGVKCWGNGELGQLGDGIFHTTDPLGSFTPVDVVGLAGPVKAISAGSFSTCALLTNGAVQCWGRNLYGGLGDGTTVDRAVPTGVSGLGSGVAGIGKAGSRGCALMNNGGAKCWGIWALGNGTTGQDPPSYTPVDVLGLP